MNSILEPQTTAKTAPLFLRALAGENTRTAPIWIMRQAGRYLPEYMALKARSSFWEMVRTPELTAEITLQPIRRFGLDAAIVFSDIMTPLPPMGVNIEFNPGPIIENPIRSRAQIDALEIPDAAEIAPFLEKALNIIRAQLSSSNTPLIGFGGAPLTLATYLIQGSGSKDHEEFRAFLRTEPAASHALLEKLTEVSIRYLRAQVAAGAQAIQLFDSWAGLHDELTYREFALPYNRKVLAALEDLHVPRIYLAIGCSHLYPVIAELPADAFSLDWRLPLSSVRSTFGTRTLQGNLDSSILLASKDIITLEARRVLKSGLGGAHVFNLGHGISRFTNPDHVAHLVDVVRNFDRHTQT
jgi:uroporphyrinogen decarboxylase